MQNDRCAAGGAAGCENRSATGLHFRRFRRALLPLAAAAALLFPGGPAARAECTAEGKTVTCTGDLSGGEEVRAGTGTYTGINIHGLTGDIEPGSGKDGLKFSGNPPDVLEIVIDTGGFDITTRGGEGILANMQGNLDITVLADKITTNGDFAYGILLETQQNGDVEATIIGDITTGGTGSDGIRVTAPGTITIEMAGDITTKGSTSRGLYAKTENGNIRITLRGGTIVSEQFAGIEFDRGATNSLTIGRGATVRISGGTSDIRGGAGAETIDNFGILTSGTFTDGALSHGGTIDLRGGSNAFNNHAGATFNSGDAVNLGSGNTFTNWGDLSPGGADAVQTTILTGNFVSEQGSTFTVTIGPNDSSDQLTVTGTAGLGGTVRVVGLHEGTYTILEAGSISGAGVRFDNKTVGSLFYDRILSYSTGINDTVTLSSTRNSATFRSFAATANQRAVAGALDSLPADNAIVTNVMAATAREEVRSAYDGLSGEVHASLKGALMDGGRATAAAVNRRLAARFGAPGARDGFWVEGHGGRSETDAASGAARMTADRRGAVFGVDRALGGGWRIGALGGYGRTELRQRAHLSSGSDDSRSVGVYGGLESGASRLGFGALYTGHAVDVRRSVRIGEASQRLSAGYDARSWQVFAEAGHRIQAGGLTLEPFAGVSHTGLDTEGFRESGGGAALTASSDTDAITFATLGLRASMSLDDAVRLRGMAGWRHASGDTAPSSAHSMAGGAPFAVAGAPVAQDALDIEFGIEAGLTDTATFGAAYTGQYGGGAGHGLTAELRLAF